MDYLFLTEEEQLDAIAKAIHGREVEHANYELNRVNYEAILASFADLPAEWPAELKRYKDKKGEEVATLATAEEFDLTSKLRHRDHVQLLLRTCCAERDKGVKTYEALVALLPKDETERIALIEKTKADIAAQKAKQAGSR